MSGWRPIEDAPTDGEYFLAYLPEGRYVVVSFNGWGGGVWADGSIGKWSLDYPIGWMPLPEPPEDL